MIKIDQDVLCDYCKEYHDCNMSGCEGRQCEEIKEIYLEEKGIIMNEDNVRAFRKLCVGDEIYRLIDKDILPSIKKLKINSVSKINDSDSLHIHYNSDGVSIPSDYEDSYQYKNLFLYRNDCEEELEKLCTIRIIELSKIIGNTK